MFDLFCFCLFIFVFDHFVLLHPDFISWHLPACPLAIKPASWYYGKAYKKQFFPLLNFFDFTNTNNAQGLIYTQCFSPLNFRANKMKMIDKIMIKMIFWVQQHSFCWILEQFVRLWAIFQPQRTADPQMPQQIYNHTVTTELNILIFSNMWTLLISNPFLKIYFNFALALA